jgi:hypothetical protein
MTKCSNKRLHILAISQSSAASSTTKNFETSLRRAGQSAKGCGQPFCRHLRYFPKSCYFQTPAKVVRRQLKNGRGRSAQRLLTTRTSAAAHGDIETTFRQIR